MRNFFQDIFVVALHVDCNVAFIMAGELALRAFWANNVWAHIVFCIDMGYESRFLPKCEPTLFAFNSNIHFYTEIECNYEKIITYHFLLKKSIQNLT